MTPAWLADAACAGCDTEAFYPPLGFHPDRLVLRICRSCPVRAECLDDALTTREQWGIRGGLTANQRVELRARQRREVAA